MPPKRKPPAAAALPQIDFPPRTPQYGDLVKQPNLQGTYQIIEVNFGGKTVSLCLMHGGQQTNLVYRNIPIEKLTWLE